MTRAAYKPPIGSLWTFDAFRVLHGSGVGIARVLDETEAGNAEHLRPFILLEDQATFLVFASPPGEFAREFRPYLASVPDERLESWRDNAGEPRP